MSSKGFTMIEIIIVIAIFIFVVGFGMLTDFNVFTGDTFHAEEAKIVSLLGRARSRAMANVYDSNFGVCYISPNYVMFQGSTCVAGDAIPANVNISENPSTIFPTFVFNRLTGTTVGGTIHITDGVKSTDIIINNEGTISW
ncbi:MAG: prepilin-type N-terminal cleavage/methylation domain-containing protein [Patescibacteria group bacterium]